MRTLLGGLRIEPTLQTFLPYISFLKSASVLDRQRLGKQRVETLQIVKVLTNQSNGWQNHPAVKMWKPYLHKLTEYGYIICAEWVNRGYKDTCAEKIWLLTKNIPGTERNYNYPDWLTEEFCLRHQSNLIRKDPGYYRSIFGDEIPDNLEYIWPV